jgi:hypothetical protein
VRRAGGAGRQALGARRRDLQQAPVAAPEPMVEGSRRAPVRTARAQRKASPSAAPNPPESPRRRLPESSPGTSRSGPTAANRAAEKVRGSIGPIPPKFPASRSRLLLARTPGPLASTRSLSRPERSPSARHSPVHHRPRASIPSGSQSAGPAGARTGPLRRAPPAPTTLARSAAKRRVPPALRAVGRRGRLMRTRVPRTAPRIGRPGPRRPRPRQLRPAQRNRAHRPSSRARQRCLLPACPPNPFNPATRPNCRRPPGSAMRAALRACSNA